MAFLCLVPIQWVKLISIGGATLKLAHLGLLIPPLALLLRRKIVVPSSGLMGVFIIHPILLGVLLASVPLSEQPGTGLFIVVRMSAYYIFGVVTFLWLSTLSRSELSNTLSKAVFFVVPWIFLVFGYYIAISGTNIIDVFLNAVRSGNPNYIQYHLFVMVLNKGSLEGLSEEEMIDAAGRHGIMIFLIIIFFSRILIPRQAESRFVRVSGIILCWLLVLFVVISLSRAAMLIFMCSGVLFLTSKAVKSEIKPVTLFAFSFAALPAFTYIIINGGGAIGYVLYEKFIVDIANNPRVFEFLQIIDKINAKAILGYGAGTELNLFGLPAKFPHNIALFWWHQAGILGLLSAMLAVLSFSYLCVRLLTLSIAEKSSVLSDIYLFSSILLVPAIVRMLVAKQGALALTEWISIALSVSVCIIYHRSRVAQDSEVPRNICFEGPLSR